MANETPVNEAPVEESAGVDEVNSEEMKADLPQQESGPETQEELKEAVEEAVKDGASEKEVRDMIEEFELKVNGKTKKVKVDLNNKDDLKRRLQLAEAGRLAMQEKAELEKLVNEELMNAQKDPWKFLEQLGLNPDDLAEQRIQSKIEEMKKSPEQLEREKMQRELEAARERLKKIEEEKHTAKMQQMEQKAAYQLDQEITDALAKETELPKSKKTVRRIADAMLWAMDNGYSDVTVADVIPSVKAEIQNELNDFMSSMPEELMEKYIGRKNIDRLRKKRLAAMRKAPKSQVKQVARPKTESESEGPKERVNSKDFFRELAKHGK